MGFFDQKIPLEQLFLNTIASEFLFYLETEMTNGFESQE